MNLTEQAPFDPDYAGHGVIDCDTAWLIPSDCAFMDIPERFVYDEPVEEWGLAEMPGPERDQFLDDFLADHDTFMGGF